LRFFILVTERRLPLWLAAWLWPCILPIYAARRAAVPGRAASDEAHLNQHGLTKPQASDDRSTGTGGAELT